MDFQVTVVSLTEGLICMPQSPEKLEKVVPGSLQMNCGLVVGIVRESTPSEIEAFVHAEKVNLDMFEWPRIYISLSRKEKEDDFFAMKGSKLPQRPKKRAKNVDKILQVNGDFMLLPSLSTLCSEQGKSKG